MSCKKRRELAREDMEYKDDRLFIIATEDTHAPKQYFEDSSIFRNSRIHVRVLPTEGGLSSPEHVLERLNQYADEFALQADDVRWLMLDTDHWVSDNHIPNFDRVCREASQQRIQLAHSNPCFEVWLLLHFTDLTADEQFRRSDEAEQRLRNVLGRYNKSRLDLLLYSRENALNAADRAEELDQRSDDRWPQKTGTHIYRLVKALLSM
jgi:hypothetical protein